MKMQNKKCGKKMNVLKKILLPLLFIVMGFFVFLFIYDYGYLFSKSERGHLTSMFFDLNKFEINIPEEQKNDCVISWNENIIYENGKLIRKNINASRYVYGDNYFTVLLNNASKKYYLFKPNNWEYHNFKFNISNDEILFWVDEEQKSEVGGLDF